MCEVATSQRRIPRGPRNFCRPTRGDAHGDPRVDARLSNAGSVTGLIVAMSPDFTGSCRRSKLGNKIALQPDNPAMGWTVCRRRNTKPQLFAPYTCVFRLDLKKIALVDVGELDPFGQAAKARAEVILLAMGCVCTIPRLAMWRK